MGKKVSVFAIGSILFGVFQLIFDAINNEREKEEMKNEIKQELSDEIERKYLSVSNEETNM